MKKKGFTLIELLAVIVILAIIALIATPIVLNIISDSKESTQLRSAEMYLKGLETSIATSTLNDKKIPNDTYEVMSNGNVCLEELIDNTCSEDDTLKVEMDGETPSSGTVTIENGQVKDVELKINNKIIVKNDKGNLVFGENKEEKVTLANYIKNLYSETKTTIVNEIEYSLDETHGLMNDRLASAEVSKLDGNIRYYGANPNNYIDIGDRDSDGNIIFWRIIGVFKNIEVTDEDDEVIKTEDLVKIIISDFLISGYFTGFSWDYRSTGDSYNNWHDSSLQAILNDEINGYYGSGQTNYYNNSTIPVSLNFTSTGLSNETHSKIERVKWNLGSFIYGSYTYPNNVYEREKSGTNTWSGKIALMYPSDYGYSTDLSNCQMKLQAYSESTCKNTNWLYDSSGGMWTISPYGDVSQSIAIYNHGGIYNLNTNQGRIVRPVMYLKSNVALVEEKETSDGLKYLVVE